MRRGVKQFLAVVGPKHTVAISLGEFFCLQNQYWKIIGLDTGYNSLGSSTVWNLGFNGFVKLTFAENRMVRAVDV